VVVGEGEADVLIEAPREVSVPGGDEGFEPDSVNGFAFRTEVDFKNQCGRLPTAPRTMRLSATAGRDDTSMDGGMNYGRGRMGHGFVGHLYLGAVL
jgi:hypothetical protein